MVKELLTKWIKVRPQYVLSRSIWTYGKNVCGLCWVTYCILKPLESQVTFFMLASVTLRTSTLYLHVVPYMYVRSQLATTDPSLSCAGFLKYLMTEVHNPKYSFICDLVLEILDSIFLYSAGYVVGTQT